MSYGTIALIINMIFASLLIVGFLIGLWRGFKKSTVNLVCSLIGVVVAFFITVPITKAILGIQINANGTKTSLQGFFLDMIMSDAGISDLVNSVPSIKTLINGLPGAIANVIVFIFTAVLVEFVMYIIYKIICIAFFRKAKTEEVEEAPKKHRLAGGFVGVAKALIISVFALMPLTSLCGLATELSKENNYFIESTEASVVMAEGEQSGGETGDTTASEEKSSNVIVNALPSIALDAVKAFRNSAFGFLGRVVGLDDALFDYYASVKINDEEVKLRTEIKGLWPVIDAYTQVSKIGTEECDKKFIDINFEKLDPVVDKVVQSGLFKTVVTDLLTEIVKNYDTITWFNGERLGDFTKVLDAVRTSLAEDEDMAEYFAHDVKNVYEVIKELATSTIIDDIDKLESKSFDNILVVVTEDANFLSFQTGLVKVFDMNLIRAGAEPFADIIMSKVIADSEDVNANTSLWNDTIWEGVAQNLSGVIKSAQQVMDIVDINTILSDPLGLLSKEKNYDLDKLFTNLGNMVDLLRANPLFVNEQNKPVIDKLLIDNNFALPTKEVIDIEGDMLTVDSYTKLFKQVFLPSMLKLRESGLYELLTAETVDQCEVFNLIATTLKTNDKFLHDVILPLYQVEPTKKLLVDNILKSMGGGFIDFTALTTYELWDSDLTQLKTILVELQNIEIDSQNGIDFMFSGTNEMSDFILKLENAQKGNAGYLTNGSLTKVLKPMMYALSTKQAVEEVYATVATAIKDLLEADEDVVISASAGTFKPRASEDQAQEVCDIFENFVPIYKEYSQTTADVKLEDLNKENVGMLLDAMKVNKYRTKGTTLTEKGIFSDAFDKVMTYFETKYPLIDFKDGASDYSETNFIEKISSIPTI